MTDVDMLSVKGIQCTGVDKPGFSKDPDDRPQTLLR